MEVSDILTDEIAENVTFGNTSYRLTNLKNTIKDQIGEKIGQYYLQFQIYYGQIFDF